LAIDAEERRPMSDTTSVPIIEHVSALPFEATLERLVEAIGQAGPILFSLIDHQAGALLAGLKMPAMTVPTYRHPKGGTPIMLGAPLAALDLPLRVLVRVRDDDHTLSPSTRSKRCSGRRVFRTRSPAG
jgi:uncharacterized protein (DUF302 family)